MIGKVTARLRRWWTRAPRSSEEFLVEIEFSAVRAALFAALWPVLLWVSGSHWLVAAPATVLFVCVAVQEARKIRWFRKAIVVTGSQQVEHRFEKGVANAQLSARSRKEVVH